MNRNTPSRFSEAPQVNIQRSRFPRHSTVKTSFNVGELIPFFVDEVLPGDTFEVSTSKVLRMQTLKTPIFDNLFLDTYFFYVPNRIIWDNFDEFLGGNPGSPWIPVTEHSVPQITAPSFGWDVCTIADYLGVPPIVSGLSVNALPFRAYAKCCEEWFRDENLQDPLVIPTGDSTVSGSNGSSFTTDVALGGKPFIANKTHDYFTSCLPAPQKGPSVSLPVLSGATLPVYTISGFNKYYNPFDTVVKKDTADAIADIYNNGYPLQFADESTIKYTGYATLDDYEPHVYGMYNGNAYQDLDPGAFVSGTHTGFLVGSQYSSWYEHPVNDWTSSDYSSIDYRAQVPVNLVADGSALSQYTSINDLRQAFQIQRFYEKLARGGSRYRELIASMFNVTIGDTRAMIPEYLGGSRLPLNVRQITQTSSNVEGQPLGDVAGMSVTNDNHFDFVKSFTEHGWIIGVMVARYRHTYQQGLEPFWLRKTKFDFYWPVFAHLGEQAVPNACIYAQGTDTDKEVFGYQEAWADYRYKPDRVSGMMRSVSDSGFDTWHFADDYLSLPYLSADWIREDKGNVDRVLTVASDTSNQIFADILVENYTTRPMPLYSIPGLIDHF